MVHDASPGAAEHSRRVLFVFLDGVGIGPDDPERNPFVRLARARSVPTLLELMGGRPPTLSDPVARSDHAVAFPLDATLDTEGTPQSGTGHTALFTGADAAVEYGRHFGPWIPVKLRPVVEERSVLRRALDAGKHVAFANAYPKGWPGARRARRIAGPPLAARAAGLLTRHEEALGSGDAVASELVNDGWRTHLGHQWLPEVTPEEAGANLARIAADFDLTLYAHYSTDTAGHRRSMEEATAALALVDGFLAGILAELPDDVTLLVASDHGNLEDVSAGHTRNPALGIVASRTGLPDIAGLDDIRWVTAFVLRWLGAAPHAI